MAAIMQQEGLVRWQDSEKIVGCREGAQLEAPGAPTLIWGFSSSIKDEVQIFIQQFEFLTQGKSPSAASTLGNGIRSLNC